ncbi:MAG: prepilin-type N-terminal cleavage/methylation domain-containing protein [Gemmatimonadota bacterium]|nr:prepilin-type N-terminal cleavage/methylation domain-containing protein [Gemmatimonadota bacterium]
MRVAFRFLCTMEEATGNTGYTLIETVVAILVFSVGALALAASSAAIGRALGTNSRREQAARIASNRLELIRADCSVARSGSEWYADIHSNWTVDRDRVGIVTALESVSYSAGRRSRTDSYASLIVCDR